MAKLTIEASRVEIYALKKLALICGALGDSLKDTGAQLEQKALTSVLVDITGRLAHALASGESK